MRSFGKTDWLRTAVFLSVAIAGAFVLTFPFAGRDTLGHILTRVGITIAVFVLLPILYKVWPPSEGPDFPTRRFLIAVSFVAVGLFTVNYYRPSLLTWLSSHPMLESAVRRIVETGGGWLLPLLILSAFTVVAWMVRRPRNQ
jgi:hypothetical protein